MSLWLSTLQQELCTKEHRYRHRKSLKRESPETRSPMAGKVQGQGPPGFTATPGAVLPEAGPPGAVAPREAGPPGAGTSLGTEEA